MSLLFDLNLGFPTKNTMAGGTSIWISSEAKTDPREIFNLRLLYLLVAVAWGGSFYGFDTGNIGGILTLPSFKHAFGLSNVSQAEQDNRKVRLHPKKSLSAIS